MKTGHVTGASMKTGRVAGCPLSTFLSTTRFLEDPLVITLDYNV
jgi:hypothetical protein